MAGKTKAIIGVMFLPSAGADAQTALDKLRQGEEPAPRRWRPWKFMVRLMRPAPLSRSGQRDDLPAQNQYNADPVRAWQMFRGRVRDHLLPVGRLDQTGRPP